MRQLKWRTVAVLAIGIAIGVTMMATPATGHVGGTVGHLWKKHIRPLADQRYGTKPQVQALQAKVAELEGKLAAVSYDPATRIFRFNGVNVQVVDGTGDTGGAPNGFGNLIVGYNADTGAAATRTGSHNLVVGDEHTYSSHGGLIAGFHNAITAQWASVTGGFFNTASGDTASVTGGEGNTASGSRSSVVGGGFNTASGGHSSVSGGSDNTASGGPGTFSSVAGGRFNTASGSRASVAGGVSNTASGIGASVSGGASNVAALEGQWLAGTLIVRTGSVLVPGGAAGNGTYDTSAIQALCLAGEQLLSGGAFWDTDVDDLQLPVVYSRALDTGNGWRVRGGNDTSVDRTLTVQALCLGP